MRLVVQSRATRRFLAPSAVDGSPEWVECLLDAGGGVVRDEEAALQLLEDCCDPDDRAVVVDLDRLGTADDYEAGEGGALPSTPLGNHGGNDFQRNPER